MRDARQYILDSMQYGMQSLLHYEDRDSMAFSIESRVPFLDYELVETIFEAPFRHKIRKGVTKALLRDGLRDILLKKSEPDTVSLDLRHQKTGGLSRMSDNTGGSLLMHVMRLHRS